MIQRLRLSRTRTALAAFVIGLALGQASPSDATHRGGCGFYPKVILAHDCLRGRGEMFLRHHERLRCIRDAEASGWHSRSPAGHGGAWQLNVSAWRSVLGPRFDAIHPADAPPWLQAAKAKRLLYLRDVDPWPPAKAAGC